MPTVLRKDGFEIMIYSHDYEPLHAHVFKSENEIIMLLIDLGVRKNYGMSGRDARKAQEIVAAHQDFLIAEWLRIEPVA